MNVLNHWGPACIEALAIWAGLIYSNRRLNELEDFMKSVFSQSVDRIVADLANRQHL
jgi:hypothetical protein